MSMYLTQGLQRSLQLTPHKLATIFGQRRQTYAEFGSRVARLASVLQNLGMKPGDRVGILSLNSDRYLEFFYGTWWGGGAVNPVNIRWSPTEVAYSLDDCDTRILLVDEQFKGMVPELRGRSKSLQTVVYIGDAVTPEGCVNAEQLLNQASPMVDRLRSGQDLAAVYYTGGTTGFPKGVKLSHDNLVSNALTLLIERCNEPDGRTLLITPMFHIAAGGMMVNHACGGGTFVIVSAFTALATLQAIQEHKVTHALLVPTMIQMTVDHPEAANYDLSSLKRLAYGASAISEAVLLRAMKLLPNTGFMQAYGMTELAPMATVLPPEEHLARAGKPARLRSAGRATFTTEVRIVDESDQEVARGTVGEVAVRGPGVMMGYWNQPEMTAKAIRDGWMHTGDAGTMDDEGFIYIVDRLKDMIVSGGENVYSAEVENALAKHADVATSAVIGIPDEKYGEGVHAVVVRKPGATVNAAELITHCRAFIAGFKCPRTVEFRDALPVSGAGKVLKTELRKPFWEGRERNVN